MLGGLSVSLWSVPGAADQVSGLGFLSTIQGDLLVSQSTGQTTQPKLHDCISLDSVQLKTEQSAYAIFSLSNTLGLDITENTTLSIDRFKQKTFDATRASVLRESSNSQMELTLDEGSFYFNADQMAALSQFKIKLPIGSLEFKKVSVGIHVSRNETTIQLIEGTLTYRYNTSSQNEYFIAPSVIKITTETAQLSPIPEFPLVEASLEEELRFAKAVSQAKARVYFSSLDSSGASQHIPVVSPEYLKQASARPFTYQD